MSPPWALALLLASQDASVMDQIGLEAPQGMVRSTDCLGFNLADLQSVGGAADIDAECWVGGQQAVTAVMQAQAADLAAAGWHDYGALHNMTRATRARTDGLCDRVVFSVVWDFEKDPTNVAGEYALIVALVHNLECDAAAL